MDVTKLLDTLERDILIVGGNIKMCRIMGGDPHGYLSEDENRLGETLALIQELKDILSSQPRAISSKQIGTGILDTGTEGHSL